jgi:sporulation protein YlmC with PRC-barrel domain
MEIPLQAQVECADGDCGRSENIIVNPIDERVTHLVVRESSSPDRQYLVPLSFVSGVLAGTIRLSCGRQELEKMEPFVKNVFIEIKVPDRYPGAGGLYGMGGPLYLPFVTVERNVLESGKSEQIPPGELAVRRGTQVEAADGPVGRVDEFVVLPESGCITHLVMREGHLWGSRDVVIPLSAVDRTTADSVYLNLTKRQVEALPKLRIRRLWP